MVSRGLYLVSKHDPDSYLPQSLSAESGKRPPHDNLSLETVLCFLQDAPQHLWHLLSRSQGQVLLSPYPVMTT